MEFVKVRIGISLRRPGYDLQKNIFEFPVPSDHKMDCASNPQITSVPGAIGVRHQIPERDDNILIATASSSPRTASPCFIQFVENPWTNLGW